MSKVSQIVREHLAQQDAKLHEAEEQARRDLVREATLDFIERWTGERELPEARQGDPYHCVLANAMGGEWNGSDWHPTGNDANNPEWEPTGVRIQIPDEVQEFIRRFDAGEYPELTVDEVGEGDV
jgi:hypothetical protein